MRPDTREDYATSVSFSQSLFPFSPNLYTFISRHALPQKVDTRDVHSSLFSALCTCSTRNSYLFSLFFPLDRDISETILATFSISLFPSLSFQPSAGKAAPTVNASSRENARERERLQHESIVWVKSMRRLICCFQMLRWVERTDVYRLRHSSRMQTRDLQ
jgi:hypothetical protein